MKKKDKIISLAHRTNLSNKEIATRLNCSKSHVSEVLRKAYDGRITLTPQRYIEARKIFGSKQDIAQYFNVSRMTLNRFERDTKLGLYCDGYMATLGFKINNDGNSVDSIWKALDILEKAMFYVSNIAPYDCGANENLKTLKKIIKGFDEIKDFKC